MHDTPPVFSSSLPRYPSKIASAETTKTDLLHTLDTPPARSPSCPGTHWVRYLDIRIGEKNPV
ncbi:MAG TPA: hypothetical protein VHO84_02070, partial [Syntrophorhabdaceae bacterium]|nr:hypothetical protein [Syntrophorhabdaceae bacterium]